MSDASTKRLVEAYMEEAPPPSFLSSQATRTHFHKSEKIEIDIERDDEDVAVVVTDVAAGARKNEYSRYTSKEFTPPIYKEESTLNGFELLKRQPGDTPYVDPDYQANAVARTFKVFRRLDWKIQRAKELMWSQVLQTGILSLTDGSGNVLYTLDFGMKSAHKAAAGAAWSGLLSSATPLTHITDRARLVTRNGKRKPNMLIFGTTAWRYFWQNTYIQALFGIRHEGIDIGRLRQQVGGLGDRAAKAETSARDAVYQGRLALDGFEFDLWVYDAEYRHPQTGNMTPYVAADNVIMKHSQSRLDMAYGDIPLAVRPEERVMPFLPTRMSSAERGLDLITNAYAAPDNTGVTVGAYARPLTVPVAIDTLACMDTSS